MSRNQRTKMENKVEEEAKKVQAVDAEGNEYVETDDEFDEDLDDFEEEFEDEEKPKTKKKWLTKANLKKAGKAVLYGAALVAVYSLGKAVEKNRYRDFDEDDYDAIEANPEPARIETSVNIEPADENPVEQETDSETEIGEHSENE